MAGTSSGYTSEDRMQLDITEVVSGFYQFANFTRAAVENYLSDQCAYLEDYMKNNHVWKNRTHMAEETLSANFYEDNLTGFDYIPVTLGISLEHGVYYGQYLEQMQEGKFAILEPTARLKGPEVINGMAGLLDRLGP